MKILYFTPLFFPNIGGIETLSMNALPRLRQKGYQFTILTSLSSQASVPVDEFEGIPIYRLPMIKSLQQHDLKAMIRTRQNVVKIKREFKPDLIHINFGGIPVGYFHVSTQNAYPALTLLTIHASIKHMATDEDALTGKLLRIADWITTVSYAMRKDIINCMPSAASRLSLIYNGVPTPKLSPLPLVFVPPTLFCSGRLVPEKGFNLAIDALVQLIPEFPAIRLIIAGIGPELTKLQTQARELGIQEHVFFTGRIKPEAMPALINQATIVIVPSRWREPFGLVAIEAAIMARPVIASNVGGLPEVIIDGKTGALVEKDNPAAFANAVRYLLNHPALASKMGLTGKENAEKNFSIDAYVNAYDKLYQKLSASRNAATNFDTQLAGGD